MSPELHKIIKTVLYLVAIAVGLFIGIAIFDRAIMPTFTRSRGTREIPELTGISEEHAREIADKCGYDLFVSRREHSDSILENFVISQRPVPGSLAKKGRRISIVVSLSVELAHIPDIENIHFRQAILAVNRAGFLVGDKILEHSDSVDKDLIIRTDPPVGTEIEVGDSVDLIVSLGSEKALVRVPNFMGQKIDEVRKIGKGMGIVIVVKYRRIPTMQPETVYRQSLESGTLIERGNTVIVIVAQKEE
jgi:serine/threonine-protein kinase